MCSCAPARSSSCARGSRAAADRTGRAPTHVFGWAAEFARLFPWPRAIRDRSQKRTAEKAGGSGPRTGGSRRAGSPGARTMLGHSGERVCEIADPLRRRQFANRDKVSGRRTRRAPPRKLDPGSINTPGRARRAIQSLESERGGGRAGAATPWDGSRRGRRSLLPLRVAPLARAFIPKLVAAPIRREGEVLRDPRRILLSLPSQGLRRKIADAGPAARSARAPLFIGPRCTFSAPASREKLICSLQWWTGVIINWRGRCGGKVLVVITAEASLSRYAGIVTHVSFRVLAEAKQA